MILAIVLAQLNIRCSSTAVEDDSPPEAQYAEGERLLKRSRYLEASERFRILKNRYPYSIYAALAALRIGDVYFEQETFAEAASAYRVFLELFPKHAQADYAAFRMGESYYKQVPDSIDRDLDAASSGITAFQRLQREHANSPHVARAQQMEKELRVRLAEKEEYVADFYFKRNDHNAAAARYRGLLSEYPESPLREKALYHLALTYEKMGEKTKALEAIERLQADFPGGKFANDASKLEGSLKK